MLQEAGVCQDQPVDLLQNKGLPENIEWGKNIIREGWAASIGPTHGHTCAHVHTLSSLAKCISGSLKMGVGTEDILMLKYGMQGKHALF